RGPRGGRPRSARSRTARPTSPRRAARRGRTPRATARRSRARARAGARRSPASAPRPAPPPGASPSKTKPPTDPGLHAQGGSRARLGGGVPRERLAHEVRVGVAGRERADLRPRFGDLRAAGGHDRRVAHVLPARAEVLQDLADRALVAHPRERDLRAPRARL